MRYLILGNKVKQSNMMSAFEQGRYYEQVNLSLQDGIHIYSRLKSEFENIIKLKINVCTISVFKHELKYLVSPYKKIHVLEAILNTLYDELGLKERGYQLELCKCLGNYTVKLDRRG